MPHFYEFTPDELKKATHADVLARFLKGADVPAKTIAGLSREQLTAFPVPGTWSIQQVLVHLLDSDLVACYRMKRIIAEDEPKLDVFNETAFTRQLFYHDQDARLVAEVFDKNRRLMHAILTRLPESAFERTGVHPEYGRIKLGHVLRAYVHHLDHHMAFVRQKRELLAR